jgi:hypothetical protein
MNHARVDRARGRGRPRKFPREEAIDIIRGEVGEGTLASIPIDH